MTPRQKKQLSYQRDRRNIYGGNHGASLKGIRKAKRRMAREGRRSSRQLLDGIHDADDAFADTALDLTFHAPATWRKLPDQPLGQRLTRRFIWRLEAVLRRHAASHPSLIPSFVRALPADEFTAADCRYIARTFAADSGDSGRPSLRLSLHQARVALRIAAKLPAGRGIEP